MSTEIVPLREGIFAAPEDAPPYLVGGRCSACGDIRFPWRKRCVACYQGGGVERIALSRTGTLYTFTIVQVASAGFEAPYAFGYVDLPEGVRIFALLGGKLDRLSIGDEVELELIPCKRDRAGRAVLGYRFVPVLHDDSAPAGS